MSLEGGLEYPFGENDVTPGVPVDHTARALSKFLPQQFRGKDFIARLVRVLIGPFDDLEEALAALLVGLRLDNATGATLLAFGALCGEPDPRGADDDTYRRRIRARIVTLRASGLIEEYIKIARLIIYDDAAYVHTERHDYSTMLVSIEDAAITNEVGAILFEFLDAATPGDQRVILQYGTVPPAELFHFDSGPGFDEGVLATSL